MEYKNISDVTEKDVEDLKATRRMMWVITSRGAVKGVCFNSQGVCEMYDGHSWTVPTNEVTKVFCPEVASKREAERTAAAMRRKAQKNLLQVGDILVSSWGYDMTIVDFYEVVKVTAKTATIRPVSAHVTYGQCCSPQGGRVMPNHGDFIGEPETHRVNSSYVNIDSVRSARIWSGSPVYQCLCD